MQLPAAVREWIEEQASRLSLAELRQAAADLSADYREGRAPHLAGPERALAYLVARMPATYAAAYAVLRENACRIGPIGSILGAGAATLAARAHFPDAALTLVERDPAFSSAARQWLPDATPIAADIARLKGLPPHDLVIAAYSLGEFGAQAAQSLWQAARVALALIEPGTPRGFSLILKVRGALLAAGAHMIAPCPAPMACPMAAPDWCHFAARVERSSLHRRVKGGELGYEDEKFSYVALARHSVDLPAARIVRHPQHRPGLIEIQSCTPQGLRTERVAKHARERFRAARHAAWGDAGIS